MMETKDQWFNKQEAIGRGCFDQVTDLFNIPRFEKSNFQFDSLDVRSPNSINNVEIKTRNYFFGSFESWFIEKVKYDEYYKQWESNPSKNFFIIQFLYDAFHIHKIEMDDNPSVFPRWLPNNSWDNVEVEKQIIYYNLSPSDTVIKYKTMTQHRDFNIYNTNFHIETIGNFLTINKDKL